MKCKKGSGAVPAEGAVGKPQLMCSLLCGCQADLNYNVQDDPAAFYGVTSQYESSENMTITCSTKVCSFGKQVVEKVEVRLEEGFGECLVH